MKNLCKKLLIIFISIFISGCLCLANDTHKTEKNVHILYEQNVGNLTNEQIDKLWPSNNPRSWILSGTMDGEITKRYKAWSNLYKSQVKDTTDKRGLEDDTDLTIQIKNLNIKAADYQDIRLVFDYISNSAITSLTHTYSLELYAIDEHNKKYGPFNVADFETTGFYMRKTKTKEIYERNFNIVTEKIKVPKNTVIKGLEIKPYGNYPRVRNYEKYLVGNWRGADATLFEIAGIQIIGFRDSDWHKQDYIKTKRINVDKTREKTVQRMYDIATVKWSPAIEFHDTRTAGTNPKAIRTTYRPGAIYYGTPYTQRNRVPIETFSSKIRDGVLTKPEDILQIWGADCSSSVYYSISKYVPLHVMHITTDYIWNRNKFSILGNLQIDGKESSTESFKEKCGEQNLYEAYALLQKGDLVSTHYKKNTHVRLISGSTHVERRIDGTIDPLKSYFIRTDIRISQANTTKGSNDFGGLITEQDYIVPFAPKKKYTDIRHLEELQGKSLNFNINRKETFKEAYNDNYVPLTLNAYLSGVTEEPFVRIINTNTKENIKNGLKGTIVSNYTIISVKFKVKDNSTGKSKELVIYPNHSSGTLEGNFGNIYSLYYNTPQDVKDFIKDTITNATSFELRISISAGEKDNMEALHLHV